jgi:hypothetical protein
MKRNSNGHFQPAVAGIFKFQLLRRAIKPVEAGLRVF